MRLIRSITPYTALPQHSTPPAPAILPPTASVDKEAVDFSRSRCVARSRHRACPAHYVTRWSLRRKAGTMPHTERPYGRFVMLPAVFYASSISGHAHPVACVLAPAESYAAIRYPNTHFDTYINRYVPLAALVVWSGPAAAHPSCGHCCVPGPQGQPARASARHA